MILAFSGTGNSLYVAKLLAASLGERLSVYPDSPASRPGERVVWVFPVYSWGVPPVVARWIASSAPALVQSGDHYAVMTCGDDAGLSAGRWRRLVAAAGGVAAGAFTVIMPNTYVLMKGFDTDPVEVADAKIAAAPARVAEIARSIENRFKGDDVTRGRFAWFKTAVIYPWFVRHAMSPRPFHSTAGCVGCGICARSCPMSNIEMKDSRPAWGGDCAMCLRCYHICPHHAVAYGHATDGKSRYTTLMPRR